MFFVSHVDEFKRNNYNKLDLNMPQLNAHVLVFNTLTIIILIKY